MGWFSLTGQASRTRLEIDVARIARVKYPENLLGVAAHLSLLFGGPLPTQQSGRLYFAYKGLRCAVFVLDGISGARWFARACERERVYRTESRLVVFLDVVAAPR